MMKKFFNWIIDKWLAGFITGGIFFSIKFYIDLPKVEKENFFNFSWLTDFFKTPVYLWQVLIICSLFIIVIVFKKKPEIKKTIVEDYIATSQFEPFKVKEPDYIKYTKDKFGVNNSIWSWKNDFDKLANKVSISDVRPNCPTCNNKLKLQNDMANSAICSSCRLVNKNSVFYPNEEREDIEEEIKTRMENGDWKNALTRIKMYNIVE